MVEVISLQEHALRIAIEAQRSPAGLVLTEAGYEVCRTGGDCWAWEKRTRPIVSPPSYALITAVGGSDLGSDLADPERAWWWVSLQSEDSHHYSDMIKLPALSLALAWAEAALLAPRLYFGGRNA